MSRRSIEAGNPRMHVGRVANLIGIMKVLEKDVQDYTIYH
jgi:hypothetical protein